MDRDPIEPATPCLEPGNLARALQDCPQDNYDNESFQLVAAWNGVRDGFPPYPWLGVGFDGLPSAFENPVSISVAQAIPALTGPPTVADVPTSWQFIATAGSYAAGEPLIPVDPAQITSSEWIKLDFTADNGCVLSVAVYIAAPIDPAEAYTLWATGLAPTGDPDTELPSVVVDPPPDPDAEDGTPFTLVIDNVSATCPNPPQYVAVGPACGMGGFPVIIVDQSPTSVLPAAERVSGPADPQDFSTFESVTFLAVAGVPTITAVGGDPATLPLGVPIPFDAGRGRVLDTITLSLALGDDVFVWATATAPDH